MDFFLLKASINYEWLIEQSVLLAQRYLPGDGISQFILVTRVFDEDWNIE